MLLVLHLSVSMTEEMEQRAIDHDERALALLLRPNSSETQFQKVVYLAPNRYLLGLNGAVVLYDFFGS